MRKPEVEPAPGVRSPRPAAPRIARRARGWVGRGIGFAIVLVGLFCAGVSFYSSAHTAGLAGTHGTLTVGHCRLVEDGGGDDRGETVCRGTFRPEAGGGSDRNATLRAAYEPGDVVAVQRTPGGYLATGFEETWRWLSLFFIGLIAASLGLPFAVTGLAPSRGLAFAAGSRLAGTRAGTAARAMMLTGVAGTVLSLLLGWGL